MQGIIGFIKPGDIIHVRRADQPSVECVRPCMIRTLNCGGMAALIFPEPRPAMTTNIVKGADRRSFIPDDDQTFAGDFRNKVITGSWDLVLMPNQHPLLGKNLLLFLPKKFRPDKVAL